MSSSSNFAFLAEHSPLLTGQAVTAKRLSALDPASCAVKLRLLAEALPKEFAIRTGVNLSQPAQAELLRAVDMGLSMDPQVRRELVPQGPADETASERLRRLAQARPTPSPKTRKPRTA